MKNLPLLTVAIPTVRRWEGFLSKSLPRYLENPLISRVIVCDETGEDADAIGKSMFCHHSKLQVFRNPVRLGAYLNKRQCIEKSPTKWVAVLDSDNHFPDTFFETLYDEWMKEGEPHTRTLYGAGVVERIFLESGKSENKTAHFEGLRINKRNWNQVLQMPFWPYMLNDGNYVLHQSVLDHLPSNVPDSETRAVDVLFVVHKLIAAGWTYHIVKGLHYYHTVHSDSEWLKTERESERILGNTNWRL